MVGANFQCGQNAELVARELDGTETSLYTFPRGRDFGFSWATDNADGSTDVYFNWGRCRGPDFGDILVLAEV